MPRSSLSTEDQLLEVALEPDFAASRALDLPERPFRLRPIHLVGLLPALAIGLALVPRVDDGPLTLVSIEQLPEPAVATTAPLLPAESRAALWPETFELISINRLGSVGEVVGPVALDGRIWLIATPDPPEARAVFFSSGDDGVTWQQAVEIVKGSGSMVIHDVAAFGGSLVALGTSTAKSGLMAAYGYPDEVFILRSSDGTHWNEAMIISNDERNWHPELRLVTDGHTILIGGTEATARAGLLESMIPPELVQLSLDGKLDVVLEAGQVSVVAPPGIAVFASERAVALPDDPRSILYRSEDLHRWEEVGVEPSIILSEALAKPGGGFVAPSDSGDMYSTIDGASWGRNLTIPPASYNRWNEWLVGLQSVRGADRLVIGAATDYATIGLPVDHQIWSGQGEVIGGPAGLASLVPVYLEPAPTVSVSLGSEQFTLRDGMFSISTEGSDEASMLFHQLPGSYDPASGTVTIQLGAGREHVVIDLDDLQGLRSSSGGVWETSVYLSPDALRWSRSSITFTTSGVEILGAMPNGFLIAFRPGGDQDGPIELYRTGPLPSEMN